jgi:thioredoxin 1
MEEFIMGKYVTVTDESFQADVLESNVPVLVDFWAPWCGPCRALAPVLDNLAAEFEGQMVVAKVNVDENMKYATQYGVQGIPRIILFKGGEKVGDRTGLTTLDTLREMVSDVL